MESGMSEENGRNPLKKSSINGDQNPPDDITVERSGIPPSLPKRIGQFHIKRLIASGGMGSVYEAVQEHPRRTVAVKVMKQGITSRSALRRFEFESQILARLRHPGIAQIYEAGTHDDGEGGVPYFAMEYIPNARPVTDYAQNRRLDIRPRLELFLQVCSAVQHGHQKGIIHRDLKPANILVDSSGQVKIIDFGVARATDSDLVVTTLQTDVGQFLGTVQYMSPEQVEADPHDIDTRSDVYALGVVLFELLVDRLPYDLTQVAVYEAARVIREQPPTKLSTIKKSLGGDLETISLKALEKDRARRYQSATELEQDIKHYLHREPISARPPSLVYQFSSFARRHVAAVGIVAVVFVALVVGIIGTSWGMIRFNEQRLIADQARLQAEREEHKATTINDFLKQMLTSIDPRNAQGREITVRELLDEVAANIDTVAPDDPELEADLRATIGSTYRNLGLYNEAEIQQRAATDLRRYTLGEEDPATLTSLIDLALVLDDQGKREESERRLRELNQILPRVLGAEHTETLRAQNNLAWLLQSSGRPAEAEPLFRWCLEVYQRVAGDGDIMTIKCMTNLGGSLIAQNQLEEAEAHIEKALALAREHLGDLHPDTLYVASNRAWLLSSQNRIDEALDVYRSVVNRAHRVMGETHPHSMYWANQLAWMLSSTGIHEEARTLALSLLETRRRVLGDQHPDTIESYRTVGTFLYRMQEHSDADEYYLIALTRAESSYGRGDLRTLMIMQGMTWNLLPLERYEEAETHALECLTLFRGLQGDDGAYTLNTITLLVNLYDAWDKPDEAAQWRAQLVSSTDPDEE